MPVVISIYNAFTGLAVGLEGFVLQNPALMIAGMLLTLFMAKAMNRKRPIFPASHNFGLHGTHSP